MDFTPDQKVDLDGAAEVIIGGKPFKVPTLPLRQTMKIMGIVPGFNEILKKLSLPADAAADDEAPRPPALLSEDDMALIAKMVQVGLSRAYPAITIDDVLDTIRLDELLPASTTIMMQTRATRKAEPGEA